MRFGLAARLALITAAMVALTALGASLVGLDQTSRQVSGDVDEFLINRTTEILDGLREGPRARGNNDNQQGNRRGNDAVDSDAEVQAIDESGAVVASVGLDLPIDAQDLALAKTRGPQIIRTVDIDGESFRMATTHVDGGGALQVARSLDSSRRLVTSVRDRVLVIGLIVAGFAGLLGWFFAHRTMRPLASLTASVETVTETQDLSTRVDMDREDEVGRLAKSFDEMLEALSRSRDQQHRLVQDAAHELRTPLTSVNANIDLLAHATNLEPAVRSEIIESVRAELRQLNTLFTEIIELATDERDRTPHHEVDLHRIAESAAERMRQRHGNEIEVRGISSIVVGDAAGLDRAISNLLSNAVKYGPANSPIVIDVESGRIAVTDQGPGIAAADQAHAFERFYRADEARSEPGSGLGLAIVEKVVTDHGGTTFIDSPPGTGATVGFAIPTVSE